MENSQSRQNSSLLTQTQAVSEQIALPDKIRSMVERITKSSLENNNTKSQKQENFGVAQSMHQNIQHIMNGNNQNRQANLQNIQNAQNAQNTQNAQNAQHVQNAQHAQTAENLQNNVHNHQNNNQILQNNSNLQLTSNSIISQLTGASNHLNNQINPVNPFVKTMNQEQPPNNNNNIPPTTLQSFLSQYTQQSDANSTISSHSSLPMMSTPQKMNEVDEKKFLCERCGKSFKNNAGFKMHLQIEIEKGEN